MTTQHQDQLPEAPPTWPQLAGWLACPSASSLRGRWEQDGETLEFAGRREPEGDGWGWVARGPDGAWRSDGRAGQLLVRTCWFHDDYHRAAGPVTAVQHAGRACWQVALEPPPHKHGLLVMVLDDETGLCLAQSNAEHGYAEQVTELEVDPELPDGLFDVVALDAEHDRTQREADLRLHEFCRQHPPPVPRWLPSHGSRVQQGGVVTLSGGQVGRAPLGQPAPLTHWAGEHVVRLDARGWSWAVASDVPMSQADARRVVEEARLD